MPENPLPVLKRQRSVEEMQPEIFRSPVEHEEEVQHPPAIAEFLVDVRRARGGFDFVWLYFAAALLGVGFMFYGQPAGALVSSISLIAAVAHFARSVILELRGSFEAAVIAVLKALEKRDE